MDRNTITGLVVIALILIGYSYFMSPSKEEMKAMHVRDSIARVEAQRAAALEKERQADFAQQQQNADAQQAPTALVFKQDSLSKSTRWKMIKSNYISIPKVAASTTWT